MEHTTVPTKADKPATSKFRFSNPEQVSHNMNDLKILDVNSADEVRQRMKEVLSNQNLQEYTEETYPAGDEENNTHSGFKSNNFNTNKLHDGSNEHDQRESIDQSRQDNERNNEHCHQQSGDCGAGPSNERNQNQSKKRGGRKPKAGPSKRSKIVSVKDMYKGKLTNLVFMSKRRRRRKSDTDSDSKSSF